MTFPPIDVLERFATCEITIEDIAVTEQENGSYTINKKNFTVSFSMRQTTTSYNYCTHSGIIIATGNAEITLSLIQSSAMGTTTTTTFYGGTPDVVSPLLPHREINPISNKGVIRLTPQFIQNTSFKHLQ